MKQITDVKIYRRLLVIALRGEGEKNAVVSKATGFSSDYLPDIVSKFLQEGFEGLLQDARTGHHRKTSVENEEAFLADYQSRAEQGEILTTEELRLAFEERFQVSMAKNSFYELLHRHGWRKIMPRRQHPKVASAEEIERSKKLTSKSKNR